MVDLKIQKNAQLLRIYIGESDRWRSKALDAALLETLRAHGLAGATVFRGVAGFGAHSRIHTSRIEALSTDLPVVIEVIDDPEKISAVIEIINPMIREGLVTLENVQIIKYTHRYLNPLPADKLVCEVMTGDVHSCSVDQPIYAVWKIMLENRIKALPVTENSGQVVGIVTDEDLLERAGLRQRLSVAIRLDAGEIRQEIDTLEKSSRKIAEVMSTPVTTVLENESLGMATALMVNSGLKRLPVVDARGRLAGMLSRLDILRQVANTKTENPSADYHSGAITTVEDVMTGNIPMVNQDDDLATIIDRFAETGSHRLVVVNSAGFAIGLISDSDVVARVQPVKRKSILEAFLQLGKPPVGKETAFDLMSPKPLTGEKTLPVVEAIHLMLAEGRKWLVVVDEDRKPVGLVDRQIMLEAIVSPAMNHT